MTYEDYIAELTNAANAIPEVQEENINKILEQADNDENITFAEYSRLCEHSMTL